MKMKQFGFCRLYTFLVSEVYSKPILCKYKTDSFDAARKTDRMYAVDERDVSFSGNKVRWCDKSRGLDVSASDKNA